MLNRHRREHILSKLSAEHRVSVMEMAKILNVSDETIRRDLKDLASEGLLRRVHGGAVPLAPIHDQPIDERWRKRSKEKGTIARLALEQISDETVIFLDTGSTTLTLARQLAGFANLKLYTNSLKIAHAARSHHGVTVHLTPGKLREVELDLVGYDTVSYIQQFYFDIAFMGIAAIDLDRGLMDYEEDESRIRKALLNSSRLRVFLADRSKFGRTGNVQTARFCEVDQIVTDSAPAREFVDRMKQSSANLLHG